MASREFRLHPDWPAIWSQLEVSHSHATSPQTHVEEIVASLNSSVQCRMAVLAQLSTELKSIIFLVAHDS